MIGQPVRRRPEPPAPRGAAVAGAAGHVPTPVAYRVLVPIVDGDPACPAALIELAVELVGAESPAEIVLSRVRRQADGAALADLAASLDSLRELERGLDDRPVRTAVHHLDAADPVAEWLHQVDALAVDLVVLAVDGPPDLVARMVAEAHADVLVVDGPPSAARRPPTGPVHVTVGRGADRDAAVEIAVRAARAHGERVTVLAAERGAEGRGVRRYLARVDEELAAVGVAAPPELASVEGGAADAGLHVVAHDVAGPVDGAASRCVVRGLVGAKRSRLVDVFAGHPAPGVVVADPGRAHGPIVEDGPAR